MFVLDESALELSPRPVLNNVTLLVVDVPANLNLTVDPDMSDENVTLEVDPVCVTPY